MQVVVPEILQDFCDGSQVLIVGPCVTLHCLSNGPLFDVLLQHYDLILEVVLGSLVLRQRKDSTKPHQKHHQHAFPRRGRSECHAHYLCHLQHVLLVLHRLDRVLLHQLQQSAQGIPLEKDRLGKNILYFAEQTV